jgi:hypothetical protein
MFRIAALAAMASCLLSTAAPAASNAKAECFKQYGAHYDASTKKWRFQTREGQMGSWVEAVNACIAQKTGRRGNYVKTQRALRPY